MKFFILLCLFSIFAFGQYTPSASGSSTAAAEINSKPAVQNGAGVPASNCTKGFDLYIDTAPAGIYGCTNTNVWTNLGGGTTVHDYVFRCLNQNTIGGCNLSIPNSTTGNPPTICPGAAGCVATYEGTSSGDVTTLTNATMFGSLSFAANSTHTTSNAVQGTVFLPTSWVSTAGITVQVTWLTSSTTGNAVWQIQGLCVASGAVPGTFNASLPFTASAAAGTTLQWTQTAVLTMTTANALTGCVAGDIFMFRLFRDHQNAGDTVTTTEELVQAVFGVTQ